MIKTINHINIVVANLERSVKFYTDVLGFKEVKRAKLQGEWIEKIVGLKNVSADVAYVVPPSGALRIELLEYSSPKGENVDINSLANTVGLRHIAFQVEGIYDFVVRLKEKNVKFISSPVKVPGSTIQHDEGYKILCYFLDPDGAILELAEYVKSK
ncbi:MAG: VOC family protein [Candidatus Omnitrophota bacterium]|nr:VOC family protein [Candidatus Omnitrophota bacterium]MBU1894670.1 VOC family protein [Candidatus Omnitrophota bacterium]